VRVLLHDVDEFEESEIARVLQLARKANPSRTVTAHAIREYARQRHRSGCPGGGCSNRQIHEWRRSAC
jgi:hypothetical protein